ncbi:MAG: preprotein translocase subunit TatB [Aeromicrobium sp.]|nr:preprotein translocase subunit TatB [Burkholderiales bacterium]
MSFAFHLFVETSHAPDPSVALVSAFRGFVDSLRPRDVAGRAGGIEPLLIDLRAYSSDRELLSNAALALLSQTKQVSLFSDAGILPPTGFVAELYRRVSHRILPDVLSTTYLRDVTEQIFHDQRDDQWLANVPIEQWRELIALLQPDDGNACSLAKKQLDLELRNAVNVLSVRLAALGLDNALLRVYPALEDYDSPFLTQHKEIQHWLEAPQLDDDRAVEALGAINALPDAMHAMVLLDQCRVILDRARKNTAATGTSFSLTYLICRLSQMISRTEVILATFDVSAEASASDPMSATRLTAYATLLRDVCLAQARRNDIREHLTQSMDLVALRVTENAGRTGDHYITETRAEYFAMFRAALGAGFVIAFMAWAKVLIGNMQLPPLIAVFSVCAMYASAFVVMHILRFSVATKQPAMTAASIAASLDLSRDEKTSARMERLTEVVARVTRSQLAAIVGNIVITLPTAIALTYLIWWNTGSHIVSPEKASKLVHEASLATLAPIYAGIAGVVLFIGGLISGYFDNKASYSRIGERLRAHHGLNRVLGNAASRRFAHYIENNLGALAGNAALGVMLGLVGPIGYALGLPLDVRHVTIATASLGLALPVAYVDISLATAFALVFGIAAIGFINLAVSFSLTLMLAFKARQVSIPERGRFLSTLWLRLRTQPRDFFLPPRESVAAQPEAAPASSSDATTAGALIDDVPEKSKNNA